MEKEIKNKRADELKGQYTYIARVCGCSPKYVSLILRGLREVKTDRAEVANMIIKTANKLPKIALNN